MLGSSEINHLNQLSNGKRFFIKIYNHETQYRCFGVITFKNRSPLPFYMGWNSTFVYELNPRDGQPTIEEVTGILGNGYVCGSYKRKAGEEFPIYFKIVSWQGWDGNAGCNFTATSQEMPTYPPPNNDGALIKIYNPIQYLNYLIPVSGVIKFRNSIPLTYYVDGNSTFVYEFNPYF